jgi:hypothetical protein
MGTAYALIFAVEKYLESGLDTVFYAETDASQITDALKQLGYDDRNLLMTLNERATKTTIEYEVTQVAKTAQNGDSIFFFFAGHGYTYNGRNYLLAYDTRRGDIVGTAVSLHHLFDLFTESACRQVMCFLDCCHSGMKLVDETRGVLEHMSQEELNEYFGKADFRVVFSACDKDEVSYPSHQWKHGYWTYHLLRALRGEEPELLDDKGRLRSAPLQDYLRSEVPKQLALQSTAKRHQNPKMYGDVSGTFVIADLAAVLAKAQAEMKLQTLGLKHTTLRGTEYGRVSGLSGFIKEKGHKAPKFHSKSTRSWIPNIANEDLRSEMAKFFEGVQRSGLYDNQSLKYDPPAEGGAAIRTPDFEFTISYSQSDGDPAEYVVTRELTRLNTPSLIESDWFNELFDDVFEEAVFEFSGSLSVSGFIDRAERIEALSVKYDPERTECRITMDGFYGGITVTDSSLTYEFYSASTPKEMAFELQDAHNLLLTLPGMQKALPLE